jgi:HpcH/HpaI aldolase/citrate lyase family
MGPAFAGTTKQGAHFRRGRVVIDIINRQTSQRTPLPDMLRPRRSLLYVPGSNSRALEKARGLPADGLIFDLEDAVTPDAKESARAIVAAALADGGYGRRELVLRVNALDTA